LIAVAAAAPRWQQRLMAMWVQPTPTWSAWLLWPLSQIYRVLAAIQRWLYEAGLLRRRQARVPVIVVGNFIVGGAGKTPAVIAIVEALRSQGRTPGVISRGHGRKAGPAMLVTADYDSSTAGDEPLLIALRTHAPVAVGSDRAAAATLLCDAHPEVDILVADDGLQHHRLRHDLAVIVIDDRGHGNGLLLPAGPLRQMPPPTLPATWIVLYSAAVASTALPGYLGRRRLAGAVELADWWQGVAARPDALAALRGQALLAAAGLARPERFFEMLRAAGLEIRALPLTDHFSFTTLPWPASTTDVVVSEKDAVKLRPERMGSTRVWVVPLDFVPEAGFGAELARRLRS
jgi:tetraacyldisaccharide 4'-kinase